MRERVDQRLVLDVTGRAVHRDDRRAGAAEHRPPEREADGRGHDDVDRIQEDGRPVALARTSRQKVTSGARVSAISRCPATRRRSESPSRPASRAAIPKETRTRRGRVRSVAFGSISTPAFVALLPCTSKSDAANWYRVAMGSGTLRRSAGSSRKVSVAVEIATAQVNRSIRWTPGASRQWFAICNGRFTGEPGRNGVGDDFVPCPRHMSE